MELIFLIVLFLYVLVSYYCIEFIKNSKLLNENQKRLNIIATILVPFLWALIVKLVITPSNKTPLELGEERRKASWENKDDNWQNLTGNGGGGTIS